MTEPNTERIVEYDLETVVAGAATGEHLTAGEGDTLRFMRTQHVRFVVEEHQPNAALAKIEVITIGDNPVLGSVERGGGVRGGTDKGNLLGLVDGDKNTVWTISGTADWIDSGHWFEIDLGATYWIDQAYYHLRNFRGDIPGNFELTTSDGSEAIGLTQNRIRSPFDFLHLSTIDNTFTPPRAVFDLNFSSRKARYLFLRRINVPECSQCLLTTFTDLYLFGQGYVADAVMESDFIDLGGTKSIRRLSWDADLPPGTFIEIRSQTGDTFLIERKFYSKSGVDISEAQWNKLPSSQKQDIVEIQRRGSDWSGWSTVYSIQDEVFLSPSPRRFAQLQVRLGNDDPDVAPLLRNIVLHFDNALISGGVQSRILPREAAFDSLQNFTYVIKPTFRFGDRGFDRVVIQVPDQVGDVEISVGGDPVVPLAVEMIDDSLRIDLPELIQRDSVEVMFQMRIQQNATAFNGWVSVVGDPLQQGIRPEDQHSTTVFVP
ncbi:MAG TPA: discoidin domain-containing protein, partial [Candidatus Handelsmanbacteria bacterium]|nr:discoidin domain-containing protein [Candidatus Handelsmanbacteria bacterium]